MKNISKKYLTLLAIVLSFLVADFAFAESASVEKTAQNKTSEPNTKTAETAEDPDLKLSIEELRKKYPIGWFGKKFGDVEACEGMGGDSDKKYNRKSFVCGFTADKSKVNNGFFSTKLLDPIGQFSEAQLKSIIINDGDYRFGEVKAILLAQLADRNDKRPLKNKIRNFFYSDKILNSSDLSSCDLLINFDTESRYYDNFALKFFKVMHSNHNQIKLVSIERDLKRCIAKNKIDSVRVKLLEEFKTKIVE